MTLRVEGVEKQGTGDTEWLEPKERSHGTENQSRQHGWKCVRDLSKAPCHSL